MSFCQNHLKYISRIEFASREEQGISDIFDAKFSESIQIETSQIKVKMNVCHVSVKSRVKWCRCHECQAGRRMGEVSLVCLSVCLFAWLAFLPVLGRIGAAINSCFAHLKGFRKLSKIYIRISAQSSSKLHAPARISLDSTF